MIDLSVLGIMGLFFYHVWRMHRTGRLFFLDPVFAFWGGGLVIYAFQPVAYYLPLHTVYSPSVMFTSMAAILWGMGWMMIGYEGQRGVRWGMKLPSLPAELRSDLLLIAGTTMILLGLLGYAYLINSAGGWQRWVSVGRGGTRWETVNGWYAVLEYFLPPGVLILLFRAQLHKVNPLTKVISWGLAVLLLLWFMYLGTRSRTIVSVLMMLAAYYLPKRKNPPVPLMVVGVILLFLFTSFQAHYRGQFTGLSFHTEHLRFEDVMKSILPKTLGGELGADESEPLGDLEINCVMGVVKVVPKEAPYNYGYTLMEVATHGIPRAIWPTKRYPLYEAQTPVMQAADLSRSWMDVGSVHILQGPSFTFVGYWYHAGGFIALTIAGYLTGAFFRMLRTFYDRDIRNEGNQIFYVLLIPIGFIEVAATPLYWIFQVGVYLAATFILLKFTGERKTVYV